MKARLFVLTLAFLSVNSFGCPGGAVSLNDDTLLRGDGVSAKNAAGEWVLEIDSLKNTDKLGVSLPATDSSGNETHRVMILGYKADGKGIFSTTYLVQWPNGGEQLMTIKTNYAGNGVSSRSISAKGAPAPELKQDAKFKSLKTAGCN